MIGSEVSKVTARRKIASTIWHTKNQKLNIIIGTQNLNMNGDAQAKVVAHNLCMDAVKYHGDTCSIGILGTQGGPKVDLTHQSQKAGTITWTNIKSGKPAIAFDFSLLDP